MSRDRSPQRTFRAGWGSTALMGLSLLAVGITQGGFQQPIQVSLLAGLPFAALAIMVRQWERGRQQQVRDTDARGILDRISRGETQTFSLYLRTFAVTGELPSGQKTYETVSPLYAGPDVDFETLLAEAVEADAPLVALGQPGEHIGAGRIVTDEATWQADILRLAERAVTIFVIPSSRPGTAWEIETIVQNGLWAKAVFLMPPGAKRPVAEAWDADRGRLAAYGVALPQYTAAGMAFILDQRGQVSGRADFPADGSKLKPSALAKAIRQAQADAATTPDVDATAILAAAELVTSAKCPKCGGAKVRPRTREERKAMRALVSPTADDLAADLDQSDELDEFSRRATCADCGTTYLQPPHPAGLISFITSAASGAVLFAIYRSGTIEGVISRPRVQEVLITGIGVLFLGLLSLAFPAWCVAKVFEFVGRKRSGSG